MASIAQIEAARERRDAVRRMLAEGEALKVAAWKVGVGYRTAWEYKHGRVRA